MKIRNLTPHAIHIYDEADNMVRTLPPEFPTPRVSIQNTPVGSVEGIPVLRQAYGMVQDLPKQKVGVFLVVSAFVRAACPTREDLLFPVELVRDGMGNVIGCRALGR